MIKKYIYIFLGILLLSLGYATFKYITKTEEPIKPIVEETKQLSLDEMDTIAINQKDIEELEKKYGESKVDQFTGNYYIDKQIGYMFEVDQAKDYQLTYNFQKKTKPDDPLLKCSPGHDIVFEVFDVKINQGMSIEDYMMHWYLPALYKDKNKFPPVQYQYENQTAYFSGVNPIYNQEFLSKCCRRGRQVIVCSLRYPKNQSNNQYIKSLTKAVSNFKLISK